MSQFELDNAITDLSQLPMPNETVAAVCAALVSGRKFGHTIMFGPPGSGKTTLANLLPKAIAPGIDDIEVFVVDPDDYNARTIKRLAASFMRTDGDNSTRKVFMIFDEFGEIPKGATKTLSDALTKRRPNCMAIFITNNIDDVAPTIVSRCYKADFTQVNYQNFVPYAERVLNSYGIDNISRPVLETIVKAKCRDLRDLMRELEDIVISIQQGPAAPPLLQPQSSISVAAPIVAAPPATPSVASITAIPSIAAAQPVAAVAQSSAATP